MNTLLKVVVVGLAAVGATTVAKIVKDNVHVSVNRVA